MNQIEVEVKLLISDEYENTLTKQIEVSDNIPQEEMSEVIEDKLNDIMSNHYDVHDQWEDCNVSWVINSWTEI